MIPAGRVIGIDLGSRRIGVAVTDSEQSVATGVATVERSGDTRRDHAALSALVGEYGAVGVVVGMPLSLSGAAGPAARAVDAEVGELRQALGVEVEVVDERLTTVLAASGLRASGRRSRDQRSVVDRQAAAELLQTWIERRRRKETV